MKCKKCDGRGWKLIKQLSGALDEEDCPFCDATGDVPSDDEGPNEGYDPDSDPVYRRDMIDAGRGHLVRK